MKYTITAVLCILSLLAGSYAQGPMLSNSFAFVGTAVQTGGGITGTYTRYDLAIDVARQLQIINVEGMVGTGGESSEYLILSVKDGMIYGRLNGTCGNGTGTLSSLQSNYWGSFDNAVENPTGTYTVTSGSTVEILVTVNGLPISYSSVTTGSSSLVITITSYTNGDPPFSLFTLPSACSGQFTCNACYSSAVVNTSSLLLLMLALAIVHSMM